mmetsp:Transcript_23160/g.72300  ORF Transcript_23160/g.72300 Transcript_23160/m.72300 type:complete len:289 (+) Transcript_23160:173-1039(+)
MGIRASPSSKAMAGQGTCHKCSAALCLSKKHTTCATCGCRYHTYDCGNRLRKHNCDDALAGQCPKCTALCQCYGGSTAIPCKVVIQKRKRAEARAARGESSDDDDVSHSSKRRASLDASLGCYSEEVVAESRWWAEVEVVAECTPPPQVAGAAEAPGAAAAAAAAASAGAWPGRGCTCGSEGVGCPGPAGSWQATWADCCAAGPSPTDAAAEALGLRAIPPPPVRHRARARADVDRQLEAAMARCSASSSCTEVAPRDLGSSGLGMATSLDMDDVNMAVDLLDLLTSV